MHTRYPFHIVRGRRGVILLILLTWSSVIVVPAFAAGNVPRASETPQLSARAERALQAIRAQLELSDWNGVIAGAEALIAASSIDSYDCAMGHLLRAQACLAQGERDSAAYTAAIASLEHVVGSGFWPQERLLDWKYQLAQLYALKGRNDDAERVIEDWLAQTNAPTPQAYILLVGILLERTPLDPARLERALNRVAEGLRLGARPDETLLYLKAACFQGLERWDDAAETLEFILSQNPRQGTRWEQLYTMYTSAGRELAAVLTIERARRFGTLDSPRADIALGQHYHNLAQDHLALDALEKGLHRGVDDPAPHWLFAAYLAFSAGDLSRASRLLAAAEPVLDTDTQRHDHARLTEALAGVTPQRLVE